MGRIPLNPQIGVYYRTGSHGHDSGEHIKQRHVSPFKLHAKHQRNQPVPHERKSSRRDQRKNENRPAHPRRQPVPLFAALSDNFREEHRPGHIGNLLQHLRKHNRIRIDPRSRCSEKIAHQIHIGPKKQHEQKTDQHGLETEPHRTKKKTPIRRP